MFRYVTSFFFVGLGGGTRLTERFIVSYTCLPSGGGCDGIMAHSFEIHIQRIRGAIFVCLDMLPDISLEVQGGTRLTGKGRTSSSPELKMVLYIFSHCSRGDFFAIVYTYHFIFTPSITEYCRIPIHN